MLISNALPADVAASESFGDVQPALLLGSEQAAMRGAALARQAEFATTRRCAREALAWLGISPQPIGRGVNGEPLWPLGIVGSMTHCAGYRAAAVADIDAYAGVGIDAEPNRPLPDGVLFMVASPVERQFLEAAASEYPAVHWDRLFFSVKEAVFKAWFPLTAFWLDFLDVTVSLSPANGQFEARTLVSSRTDAGAWPRTFSGRFVVQRELILTATAVGWQDL